MGKMIVEVRELPPEKRPREKLFARGVSCLSDIELITIIIGSGIKGKGVSALSAEILANLDKHNYRVDEKSFSSISGLGKARIAVLSAGIELARRVLCPEKRRIASPGDVYLLVKHFADRKQELFLSVSLNGAHEVIAVRTVSVGLLNRALVHPREVFSDPLKDRAAAVIVCHNHPSGNTEPSDEDRDITKRLKDAGEILGITLLDHIVFSETGYTSVLTDSSII